MNIKKSIAFAALTVLFATASGMAQTGEKLKAATVKETTKVEQKGKKYEATVNESKNKGEAKVNDQIGKSKAKVEEVKKKEDAKIQEVKKDIRKEGDKAEEKLNQIKRK
ncbi:hypothetical protein [Flavobacterium sp. JP2137]|uniref:hypothetical protein n=1 Tax=Flavobacterium sp. JP2137 TaxID=3414510 RepID=UPI003D301227